MKLVMLSPTDQQFLRATHKVIITAADVAAGAGETTLVIPLVPQSGTFPAGTEFAFAKLQLVTPFDASDASINSLLIEIGETGGDTDRILTSTQLAVDGTEILYKSEGAVSQPYTYAAADSLDALFTVAGGANPTLGEINAGEVHIYLHVSTPQNHLRRVNGPLG